MEAMKQTKEYKLLLIMIPDTTPTNAITEWDMGHEMENLSEEFVAAGRDLAKLPCTIGIVYAKSNTLKNFTVMHDRLKDAGLTNFALVN